MNAQQRTELNKAADRRRIVAQHLLYHKHTRAGIIGMDNTCERCNRQRTSTRWKDWNSSAISSRWWILTTVAARAHARQLLRSRKKNRNARVESGSAPVGASRVSCLSHDRTENTHPCAPPCKSSRACDALNNTEGEGERRPGSVSAQRGSSSGTNAPKSRL